MAGGTRLVEHALRAALLESAPRTVLVGGEERGTWMLDCQMASDCAFAFALSVSNEAAGAVGRIRFETSDNGDDGECPTLSIWLSTLAGRRSLAWHGGGGHWTLDWL